MSELFSACFVHNSRTVSVEMGNSPVHVSSVGIKKNRFKR